MNQSVAENSTNNEKIHHITNDDLPLSCPNKGNTTWNSHPKVYLSLSENGEAHCPYCGAHYILDSK